MHTHIEAYKGSQKRFWGGWDCGFMFFLVYVIFPKWKIKCFVVRKKKRKTRHFIERNKILQYYKQGPGYSLIY